MKEYTFLTNTGTPDGIYEVTFLSDFAMMVCAVPQLFESQISWLALQLQFYVARSEVSELHPSWRVLLG